MNKEGKKSKGSRFFVGVIIAVAIINGLVPATAYISNLTAQHTGGQVLAGTQPLGVFNATLNETAFSFSNGTLRYTDSINETVSYSEWNVSIAQLNEYSVYNLTVTETGQTGNITAMYGNITANYTSKLVPLNYANLTNGTATIALTPSMLQGNGSDYLFIKVNQSAPVNLTLSIQGSNGLTAGFLGTIPSLDMGFIVAGFITLFLAYMISPFHEQYKANPIVYFKEYRGKRRNNYRPSNRKYVNRKTPYYKGYNHRRHK